MKNICTEVFTDQFQFLLHCTVQAAANNTNQLKCQYVVVEVMFNNIKFTPEMSADARKRSVLPIPEIAILVSADTTITLVFFFH
jgi:hypothetical protein